jgi:hypothetical protein
MSTVEKRIRLDEAVADLFRCWGFMNVEAQKSMVGRSENEIIFDIYAEKKKLKGMATVAAMCKSNDYGDVTKEDMGLFVHNLVDCKIEEGYFFTDSYFEMPAFRAAKCYGVIIFDRDKLNPEFQKYNIPYYCHDKLRIEGIGVELGKMVVDVLFPQTNYHR